MSELRYDILTGNWVVISPERGKKPVSNMNKTDIKALDIYNKTCPFCPGNEEHFDIHPLIEKKGNKTWQTRVIENKYKIFDNLKACPDKTEPFQRYGIYSYYTGCGNHYVVLEHPEHNKIMGQMTKEEIFGTFEAYLDILKLLKTNKNNFISIIFKNQGKFAGASQDHSHSQVVGSRIIPAWIRNGINNQERYFDSYGYCPMCHMLEFEASEAKRVVQETQYSMILSPYAAGTPYEMWIIPKRHFAWYGDISRNELEDISEAIQKVLLAYDKNLDSPDYNYFINSSPDPLSGVPFYHMFIKIEPRLWNINGFEMGTKFPVNIVMPENAIEIFR